MDEGLLSLKWNSHGTTFFHVLSLLREKELYTDVTLSCGGKFFPVHRLVLATCSDYFLEIFEKTSCKAPVIILKDINPHDIEILLEYMYLGEVEVQQTELSNLIKAAECLQIKGLAVPDENATHKKRSPSPIKYDLSNKKTRVDSAGATQPASQSSSIKHTSSFDSVTKPELPLMPIKTIKLEEEDNINDCNLEKFESYTSDKYEQEEDNSFVSGPSHEREDNLVPYMNDSQFSLVQDKTKQSEEVDWLNHDNVGIDMFKQAEEITNGNQSEEMSFNLKPYSCDFCTYKAKTRTLIRRHMLIHTREKYFSCPQCSYKSSWKDNLKRHVFLKHTQE